MMSRVLRFLPLLYACAVIAIAGMAFAHLPGLKAGAALDGIAVLDQLAFQAQPAHFARDFPGFAGPVASLAAMAYQPVQAKTGLDGLTLMAGAIWLEIAALVFGAWLFWRFLIPQVVRDGPIPAVTYWAFGWLAAVLAASALTGRGFDGVAYGFGAFATFGAIVCALRQRWSGLMVMLVAVFTVQAPLAGACGLFVLAAMAMDARRSLKPWPLMCLTVAAVLCAAWAHGVLGWQADTAGSMPVFPARTEIAALAGLMIVSLLGMVQAGIPRVLRRQMVAGFMVLAAVAALGLWVSGQDDMPVWVAVLGAGCIDLIRWLAPFFVVAAALAHWRERAWGWTVFHLAFLFCAFFDWVPPSFAVAMVAVHLAARIAGKHFLRDDDRVMDVVLLGGGIGLGVVLAWVHAGSAQAMTAAYILAWAVLALVVLCAVVKLPRQLRPEAVRIVLVSGVFLAGAWTWGQAHIVMRPEMRDAADAAYRMQVWAENNTEGGALFMLDPCMGHGWHAFSQRAALGTADQWWGRKGQSIAQALGTQGGSANCTAAQAAYYDPSLSAVQRLVDRFGVDYLVMRKNRTGPIARSVVVLPLYENAQYAVYAAKDLVIPHAGQ